MSGRAEPDVARAPDEMSLRDYVAIVRRRKWWVIVPTVLAVVLAVAWSMSQPDRFRGSTDVLVTDPPSAYSVGQSPQPMQPRVLNNELERASGSAMVAVVRQQVGKEPALHVRLASEQDSDVFVFTAESGNAQAAADAANAYGAVYIADRRARLTEQINANIGVLQDRVDSLDGEISKAQANGQDTTSLVAQREEYERQLEALRTSVELAASSGATVIDAAIPPSSPYEPTPLRTGMVVLVIGLLVGLAAAFLRDRFDTKLRSEDDLRRATGFPVLGVIPRTDGKPAADAHLVTFEEPTSRTAEAYRGLRTALQFLRHTDGLSVIQVTSPKPGDGKTTTATNLAVVYARAGQRVLLVDGDLRRPQVHRFFGVPNTCGLADVLAGKPVDSAITQIEGEQDLCVITAGALPDEPSELLSGDALKILLVDLTERYDVVIVDSPPVLAVSDPLVLAGAVDGVVLVVSASTTDMRQATHATRLLAQVEAPVLGTVLSAFEPKKASTYDYRYAYQYTESR